MSLSCVPGSCSEIGGSDRGRASGPGAWLTAMRTTGMEKPARVSGHQAVQRSFPLSQQKGSKVALAPSGG